ncbi:hypothetical protein H8R29_17160 [Priestia megaterium]|uniref:Putative lipoprotein n=1 Tax=Priestia megaterium (strain ATCC 14581 / DSM 32 / CCUG 1817 / JCM 2506 / NBRC 15308 / NCIMB 9376 / NCTC 10342 / NRRL B-14308 / VKM B-512 / Ford 19) TaxID=1348623 RepID=A0A0B6AMJ1_PRIM2|nr:hypothetical protein [Priestia megaterium]AJI21823.1 putative lipoprotein [Priestia megaterium NBRC 15308 = ATCC 14581]KFN05238.1 putative lipoprotein [Priestia megaterium]KGJ77394.1 hypothetical protein BMT_26865 [Priestia megaterium NBRC 15308 = ATCC 14581]MDR4229960.1 hypothetical protein [Priestia megaterium]MED3810105.1 hypothetical protein [Priestia megaterium]
MKEKAFGVVYALLTLFILGACSTEDVVTNNSDPKVSVSTTVKPLTKKEFSEVGTSGLTSSSKKDFHTVHMILTLRGTDYLSNIQVKLPNYKEAFNNIKDDQQIRYWFGSGADKEQENKNIYTREFVLYTKGLTDKQIKEILSAAKVKTSWVVKDTQAKDQSEFAAGKNIKFEAK